MNPKQALEQAAYAFAAARTYDAIAATSIYRGLQNLESVDETAQESNRVHPSITLIADGNHTELVLNTRLFRGNLIVRVEADAQNVTDSEFNDICEDVFSKFNITTLASALSSAKDPFTCQAANVIDNGTAIRNGSNWQNELTIDCVYGQADL